ncbi:hypothetical protein DHEL01_v200937 [Diaporthe helianthi]|uniref:Uncharacterized protein n=1 Tax=Diaporthe helianthi TaxID=158607 RepID=A0A2P5IDT1_DIAHE|nr:hypothetical protein DHEL01_v200937 [Diaporthe helianthi]
MSHALGGYDDRHDGIVRGWPAPREELTGLWYSQLARADVFFPRCCAGRLRGKERRKKSDDSRPPEKRIDRPTDDSSAAAAHKRIAQRQRQHHTAFALALIPILHHLDHRRMTARLLQTVLAPTPALQPPTIATQHQYSPFHFPVPTKPT